MLSKPVQRRKVDICPMESSEKIGDAKFKFKSRSGKNNCHFMTNPPIDRKLDGPTKLFMYTLTLKTHKLSIVIFVTNECVRKSDMQLL